MNVAYRLLQEDPVGRIFIRNGFVFQGENDLYARFYTAGKGTYNGILLVHIVERLVAYFPYKDVFMFFQAILIQYFGGGGKPVGTEVAPFFQAVEDAYLFGRLNNRGKEELVAEEGIDTVDAFSFGIVIELYDRSSCKITRIGEGDAAGRNTDVVFMAEDQLKEVDGTHYVTFPEDRPFAATALANLYSVEFAIFLVNDLWQFATTKVADGHVPAIGYEVPGQTFEQV